MGRLLHILFFVLLAGLQGVFGQGSADAHVREGDRYFEQLAYARAVLEYKEAADLGAINEHVSRRLGECNMRLGNTGEAERWFGTVVKFLNREPRDLYRYAQALKSNGRYLEAEEWMDRYLAMVDPENAPHRSNVNGFAKKFSQGEPRFTIRPVSINSEFSDFGTSWFGTGKVLFSSARNVTIGIERRAAWNDQPFLDLYVADLNGTGDLTNPVPLSGSVNTKMHEGPATASANGDIIWFTRNNFHKGRTQRNSKGISKLGIFKAGLVKGDYTNIEPFLFNNSEVSMAHPALAPNGRELYFVSDMPGGFGGSDIYVSRLQGTTWSEPRNLGSSVNTAASESFPFVASDGVLYFASDGHPGLGGLDIYAAQPAGDDQFSPAINVGAPVNGPKDDFAFIIDAANKKGFFSSNRPEGKGSDDIYAFTMLAPLEQRYLCTGVVIDAELEIPVVAAEVELFDMDDRLLGNTWTDALGEFAFPVDEDKAYRVVAHLKGRYDGERHFSTENIERTQIITRDIRLVADAGIWLRGAVRYKDRLGFIQGMTVSAVNLSSFFSETKSTSSGGDFSVRLQSNEEFEVLFEKEGFFSLSVPVSTRGMKDGIIYLDHIRELAFEEISVGTPIPLQYIRWQEGKAVLDPIARTELDILADRLLVNPRLLVEIGVHDDGRGDPAAKLRLTQKRAQAIVDHLVKKGVPQERLKPTGYGITRPVNHCLPGIPCTEEEHAANRREEYTITAIRP